MHTINKFVSFWCTKMTTAQLIVADTMISQNRVIGVAKSIGGIDFCPLVSFGKMQPCIIDGTGYYQLASKDSIKLLDN